MQHRGGRLFPISPQDDGTRETSAAGQSVAPSAHAELGDWALEALRSASQVPARHHLMLMAALDDIATGATDRLMLLMPPGSAKSTYASVLFPPFWFTRHPRSSIIAASHTADLAAHFGRQVRATVREHEDWLGYSLAERGGAATRWQTSTGGQYFATGVRGPMVGRRADLVIIDDPVKSYHEADNARARSRLWEWYRSELLTRLRPGARVVVIMTRWHEDDLGGRLLAQDQEGWRCLRLPALAEVDDPLGRLPGEPLWPEWEGVEALARKRAAVGERTWSAQYQQQPMPPDGKPFHAAQFDLVDRPALASDAVMVRAWDLAATPKSLGDDPDWTVGLKLLREQSGRFVVLDVVRLRGTPHVVEQAILRAAADDGAAVTVGIPQDPGQAGKVQVTALTSRLAGYRVVSSRETGSKMIRALPVVSQLEGGNFALVKAAWNQAFLEELADFPHGPKDDQVDALSRAFALLLEQGALARRVNVSFLPR